MCKTALPKIETDLLDNETALLEIGTTLPQIEIVFEYESRFQAWKKLGRFIFDISLPQYDNPNQVSRWSQLKD